MIVTEPTFTKVKLTRQLFVKIVYTKFNEIQTNVLAADTRSHIDRRAQTDVVFTQGFLFDLKNIIHVNFNTLVVK
jgi:hypothetical protein